MWKLTFIVSGAVAMIASVAVQAEQSFHSPYKGEETRAIKSLSQKDIEQLSTGQGWGLAKAAELNGMPGPMHVLEMRETLGLTQDQIRAIEDIYAEMKRQAIPLGRQLIEQERALNEQFANKTATPDGLNRQLGAIAETMRELRYVHLAAHLETPRLLTAHQLAMYNHLRGYGDNRPHEGGHGHGH